MTTKKRKAAKNLDPLDAVRLYMEGTSTPDIAKLLQSTDKAVNIAITRHIKKITNLRESNQLVQLSKSNATHTATNQAMRTISATRTINKEFLDKLSDPTDVELTDEEGLFALVFAMSGDPVQAIKEAGLDKGLQKTGSGGDSTIETCYKLRATYLRHKWNVQQYILRLREERWLDNVKDIDREWVQKELLVQYRELMENPGENRKQIDSIIRMIGQTVGAFIEKIEVTEISTADALDSLIEAAKDVTPLEEKTAVIEMRS